VAASEALGDTTTDGKDSGPITNVPAGSCAMQGHLYPVVTKPAGFERAIPKGKPSCITPRVVEHNGVLGVEYRFGDLLVGRSTESAPAGEQLRLSGKDLVPVEFLTAVTDSAAAEAGRS
jgi:hypothetical protein